MREINTLLHGDTGRVLDAIQYLQLTLGDIGDENRKAGISGSRI